MTAPIFAWLHQSPAVLCSTSTRCWSVWETLMCHDHHYKSNWLHYAYHTFSCGMVFAEMPARLWQLRIKHQYARFRIVRQWHEMLLFMLMLTEEVHKQHHHPVCWVKLWIQRCPLLGQYEILMCEVMRPMAISSSSWGCHPIIMFLELVQRVSPRITKQHHLVCQWSGDNCRHITWSSPDSCFVIRQRKTVCCWLADDPAKDDLTESFDVAKSYRWGIILMWQLQLADQKLLIGHSTSKYKVAQP